MSIRGLRLLPAWLTSYQRVWLPRDLVAGLIVWSVVVPQAVAYAQIAGLPPSAGLVAAPGALIAYAFLGTSRTLIVSATTATSALSAAAVGPLAHGNTVRFAALSAALALVAGLALAAAGALRIGGIMDLVSKPVMTGFLFGLGLFVAVGQLPKLFGVPGSDGNFFPRLWHLLTSLDDTQWWTFAVGAGSVAGLIAAKRLVPKLPATLIVLVAGIVLSALFDLKQHGVAVVGPLPAAFPHPAWPDVSLHDFVDLLAPAFGVVIITAEAIGVGRTLASQDGYRMSVNRDLVALGASNVLAGLSPGFVESGGASQTMANEQAGAKTQLSALLAAGLILLTGAFLSPLFKDLPEATLAAIVIVAISGFFRVDELRRFARLRRSAIVLALIALVGVLVIGVLPGLILAAVLSLILLIQRLSRPTVGRLGRNPVTGAWGRIDRHPDWEVKPGVLVCNVEGPLFYANSVSVKERLLDLVEATEPPVRVVVLGLAESPDLDVETLDSLGELADALAVLGITLRLALVRVPVHELLRRSGLSSRIEIEAVLSGDLGSEPEVIVNA